MTPRELKNSILQLAIQGKLVEQRPEEGTAEELLQTFTFTRTSDTAVITEDEIPFEIPNSWKWVRHNALFEVIGGSQPPKAKFIDQPKSGYVRLYQTRDYGEKPVPVYVPVSTVSKFTRKGDILLARYGGSLGKVFWAQDGAYNVALAKVISLFEKGPIDSNYLYYYYHASLYQNLVRGNTRSAQAGFNKEDLNSLLFPLPPLAEQKRIVAKIEELLPLIDRYEQAWTRLEDFNKRFPGDMQKSLLLLAIQGKLVEQRPEEGTGEELYRQIQIRKQALIRSGKLKKEKSLPEIADDEKPFDIPENWVWARVGNIGSWSAGATPSRTNPEYFSGSIPWLKTGDLTDGYVYEVSENVSQIALEKTSMRLNPIGSVLMAMYGATIGKLGIAAIPMTTNQACCACIPYDGIYNLYLFYYLLAMRKAFIKMGEGGAQPNISKEKIISALIPIPPLAEQKRIVAKLKELLPLCDKLR